MRRTIAKFLAKRHPSTIRRSQYEETEDNDDDHYASSNDSISSLEGSDSEYSSRFSPRNPSREESQQLGPAGIHSNRRQMMSPALVEKGSNRSIGGQAPPRSTRDPAVFALSQSVPQQGTRKPAQRHQNSDAASPRFEDSQRRSPASTDYDGHPLSARPMLSTHRSVPAGNPSIPRKPINKPEKRILIAVFGMTGTGKTSFIKTLAGEAASQLRIGHGLQSCTQDIETADFSLDSYNVTLVDTPGFDDSIRSDTEILKLIADWLGSSYRGDTLLSGIIYLHRISDTRMSGCSFKNLRMFRKLCGAENMSKVCLLTTRWDEVNLEDGLAKERELEGQGFWGAMISEGCTVRRHDRGIDSAREVVCSMLANKATPIKLQEEMAEGKTLIQTDAGSCINEEILELQRQYEEELNALKDEMDSAMLQGNEKLQVQLRAEHAQIVSELEKQAEHRYQLAQTQIGNLERRLQDAVNERERNERNLRISAARDHELRIIAKREREQAEQCLAEKKRDIERGSQMSATREHVGPLRERGGYEEHSSRQGGQGNRDRPNTVKARRNTAPLTSWTGSTTSETKTKREKYNGQPYKTFVCYDPKRTFRSPGCGQSFDVVNPEPGKIQCYCGSSWTIWGRDSGRLR